MALSILFRDPFLLDLSQCFVRTDSPRVNDAIHFRLLLSVPYCLFCLIKFCAILYMYPHDESSKKNKYAWKPFISWYSQDENLRCSNILNCFFKKKTEIASRLLQNEHGISRYIYWTTESLNGSGFLNFILFIWKNMI